MNTWLLIGLVPWIHCCLVAVTDPPPAAAAKLEQRLEALEREVQELKKLLATGQTRNQAPSRPAAPGADLLTGLQKDWEELARGSTRAQEIQRARALFARGEAREALDILRRARSKAGVPLILHTMLRTAQDAKKPDLSLHLLALTLLTGEDVETLFHEEKSVPALVTRWWQVRRDKIQTDPERLTTEQWSVLARRLRDLAPMPFPEPVNGLSYTLHSRLYQLFLSSSSEYRQASKWLEDELHPALLPAWLAGMGHHPNGNTEHEAQPILYQLVPLLGALRKNGQAPQLDKIAEDGRQNAALRLTCLLALHAAGEEVRVPALLTILAQEKKLERRVLALEFLYYAADLKPAVPFLLETLDDPNDQIRQSTRNALKKNPPAELLPALKKMADRNHAGELLEIIAAVKTPAAKQYLADNLASTMKDGSRIDRISDALSAFQHAVGQQWGYAGQWPFAYYHKHATRALEWWKANKDK